MLILPWYICSILLWHFLTYILHIVVVHYATMIFLYLYILYDISIIFYHDISVQSSMSAYAYGKNMVEDYSIEIRETIYLYHESSSCLL